VSLCFEKEEKYQLSYLAGVLVMILYSQGTMLPGVSFGFLVYWWLVGWFVVWLVTYLISWLVSQLDSQLLI
jgi:hypothetical protein